VCLGRSYKVGKKCTRVNARGNGFFLGGEPKRGGKLKGRKKAMELREVQVLTRRKFLT